MIYKVNKHKMLKTLHNAHPIFSLPIRKYQTVYAAVRKHSEPQWLGRGTEMGVGQGFSLVCDVTGWVVSPLVAASAPEGRGAGEPGTAS